MTYLCVDNLCVFAAAFSLPLSLSLSLLSAKSATSEGDAETDGDILGEERTLPWQKRVLTTMESIEFMAVIMFIVIVAVALALFTFLSDFDGVAIQGILINIILI